MARSLNIRNLYDKVFDFFPFVGLWLKAMGMPETCGAWLLFGLDKNGKTWFALLLAAYLSTFTKVLYISAEEGVAMDFVAACKRAKLEPSNKKLLFREYMSIEDLRAFLRKRKSPRVVFIDNVTMYTDELRATVIKDMLKEHKNVLFVFMAHEEKGLPSTAAAKLVRKLAKIILHVKGLTAFISGRCPGGTLTVDEEKAALYWGMPETETL